MNETQSNEILSPQALRIYELLKDGVWHCPIDWNYADGHTKRITDINNYLKPLGQQIESQWCDCGRHVAKIKKRRLVDKSVFHTTARAGTCCFSYLTFQVHDKDCEKIKEKVTNTLF